MPTIKDVAKEAGVSIATVSYVINNKTASISEDTRREVLDAARRIGYSPNVTARNLKLSRSRLIGYAWHKAPQNQVNSVLDQFIYYLAHTAEAAGYHLLTFTYPAHDPVPVYEDLIRTRRVDAFVVADTVIRDERIHFLLEEDFPFVSFGRSFEDTDLDWEFPYVDTDGRRGIEEAVEHLISLGHQRIAFAAWPEDSGTGNERLGGYLQALSKAGIPLRPDYVQRGEHNVEAGRAAFSRWCEFPADEQPTAVVAVSDLMAIGVMNEAQARGYVVGETMSVIGFDDAPLVQYLRPALITIQQPIADIGRELIGMLETILDKQTPRSLHRLVAPKLVIRESTGAPR